MGPDGAPSSWLQRGTGVWPLLTGLDPADACWTG